MLYLICISSRMYYCLLVLKITSLSDIYLLNLHIHSQGDKFREIPLSWTKIENGYGVFAGYDYTTFEFIP